MDGRRGELEALLSDTIVRVADIHKRWESMQAVLDMIPRIEAKQDSANFSAQVMADSAKSMAETLRIQRTDYTGLVKDSRESIPRDLVYSIVKWVVIVSSLPSFLLATLAVLYTLSVTKQEVNARLDGVSVIQTQNRAQTREEIQRAKEDIKQEMSKIANEVNSDAKLRDKKNVDNINGR